jgi:RimJ/RimL family protein N-acetyltransferase
MPSSPPTKRADGSAVTLFSPQLTTARLELCNIGPEHRDFVLRHFADPEVNRFLVDADPVREPADADEIIEFYEEPERRLRNRWVLLERPQLEAIGTVGLHALDRRRRKVEIGYDLDPARWGRGLMSEALSAVLDHVFDTLGLYRIEAFVDVDNDRSGALLRRLGFVREGTLRAMYFFDGRWHDHHLYALLATDRAAANSAMAAGRAPEVAEAAADRQQAKEGASAATIRAYSDDDIERILEIWFRASLVAHPFLDQDFLLAEREQIVDHWLPMAATSVYEIDGRVMGFLSLIDNEVGAIFVDPDHHGEGVGRALMDRARATRPHLELDVFELNWPGRRFYVRYGFRLIGRHVHTPTGYAQLRLRLD